MECTVGPDQRQILLRQADMILRAAEEEVAEELDLEDIRRRHREVVSIAVVMADSALS